MGGAERPNSPWGGPADDADDRGQGSDPPWGGSGGDVPWGGPGADDRGHGGEPGMDTGTYRIDAPGHGAEPGMDTGTYRLDAPGHGAEPGMDTGAYRLDADDRGHGGEPGTGAYRIDTGTYQPRYARPEPQAARGRRGRTRRPAQPMTLGRASGMMAVGTIASRATGFLRTVAIAAAIGTASVGDAYNVANTTPNILYDLLLGGVLSSVVVPVLVRATKEDDDGGELFASSLITLVTVTLFVAVVIGIAAAPLIVKLYLAKGGPEQHLAVTFLRYFLPQVAFYGIGATVGAILNVRQSFAAPMFAPVLNNIVVIGTCIVFIFLPGPRPPTVTGMTSTQTTVLAVGTTLGVVIMTIALFPSLRTVGFRYQPRLVLRDPRLRHAARLAGWTLLYVGISQVGYLVIVRLSSSTTAYTTYTYAYQIFQLPHAIIAVSVITALLPRMSAHAADGQRELVRDDLSAGMRLTAVVLVPSALVILALGKPLAIMIFHHGAVTYQGALLIGETLAAFAVALVPFSMFQLQLRAFYALQDSRTPALVNIAVTASNIVAAVALAAVVPEKSRGVALALAFAISYGVGTAISVSMLRKRLDGIDGSRIIRLITQVAVAGGVAAILGSAFASLVRSGVGKGWLGSGVASTLAIVVAAAAYLFLTVRMQLPEIKVVTRRLRRGLRR